MLTKVCCAGLIFDPIFAKLGDFQPQSFKICRGCTKPLYEASDFNCFQFGQSWHQIGDNLIPKSNFVLIEFNFL